MTGYTRTDTANNIADGKIINASDLDGEYDAIQAAFHATTGHTHDGTTGGGAQISAADVSYDNTNSGLTSTNVNAAIDEVKSSSLLYETNSWTPTITGLTTAGSGTYSTRVGTYTKIGNCVFFTASLVWTAHTGVGKMQMSLPFTTSTDGFRFYVFNVYAYGLSYTATETLVAKASYNSTVVNFYSCNPISETWLNIDSSATLQVTGHYFV